MKDTTEELIKRMWEEVEQQITKEWETIGIENDFMFCRVMQNEELLSELIHMILPDVPFTKLTIQAQKSIEMGADIPWRAV